MDKTDSTSSSPGTINLNADSIPQISVFPSPSENGFTFEVLNLSGENKLEIYVDDPSGRPVFTTNGAVPDGSSNYQFNWDAAGLTSGLYIYRVKLNGRFYSGKIVKI